MTFQRGDVVLIPFPYSDLTARKTRPSVVVSDAVYHSARSEFLVAYISSQLSSANEAIDYVLQDYFSSLHPNREDTPTAAHPAPGHVCSLTTSSLWEVSTP